MDKKGISPLIATVLIIGFTVALAAVVMTWGGGFIREQTESTETTTSQALKCVTDLDFQIKNVSCGGGGGSDAVIIDNKGAIDIKSFLFRIHAEDGTVTNNDTAGASGLNKYNVATFTVGNIGATTTKVEAIATLAGEEGASDFVCEEAIESYSIDCNG